MITLSAPSAATTTPKLSLAPGVGLVRTVEDAQIPIVFNFARFTAPSAMLLVVTLPAASIVDVIVPAPMLAGAIEPESCDAETLPLTFPAVIAYGVAVIFWRGLNAVYVLPPLVRT